jgi:hypothetical protein
MSRRTALAHSRSRTRLAAVAAFLVIAVLGFGWAVFYAYGTERTQTCTVTGTDWATSIQVTNGSGQSSSEYRVQTAECGVLRVEDVPLRFQFNSADLFSSLEEGQTYELTTIGWRNGFLSWFPVIVAATPGGAR